MTDPVDILVVGGGPVGLYAALKGAVLNQTVALVDKGRRFSRVALAKEIASVPGRSPTVSGEELLEDGRRQIRAFERRAGKSLVTILEDTEAVAARREDGLYRVRVRDAAGDEREVAARTLVLATGVVDRKPGIDSFHAQGHWTLGPYVHRGEVGYCLLCEGWSVEGKSLAVIGCRPASAQIACDLKRHFEGRVTLLTDGERLTERDACDQIAAAKVAVDERPIEALDGEAPGVRVRFRDGSSATFDKAFFALGWYKVNNDLAVTLGAQTTPDGYVVTDENSEVLDRDGRVIRGLFAVGDLRAGRWKQIVIGWGDAESAITHAYAYRLPSTGEK